MSVIISAETTVDLPKDLLKKYNIKTVPFSILIGDKSYYDGDLTPEKIFELSSGKNVFPKTSAVNVEQFKELFSDLLKTADAVIHFSLSSKISSAYNNAVTASKEFNNVYVVDSLSLSTGIACLAVNASEMASNGDSVENIYAESLKLVDKVQASFVLDKLDYIYKGGRCTYAKMLSASILKIHPSIIMKGGELVPNKKYMGSFGRSVKLYVKDTLEEYHNPDLKRVFITYSTADDEVVETVKEELSKVGFNDIFVTRAGGTVSSHCGENCLGILYLNK